MSLELREFTHVCRRCGAWFTNNAYAGGLCGDCEEATRSDLQKELREREEARERRERKDREYAEHAPKMTVREENGRTIVRYGTIPAGANAANPEG